MRIKLPAVLILTLACVLGAGSGLADEAKQGTWVTDEGHAIAIHSPHNMFFHEGGETFDLADLEDGESRRFGDGAKQVTVTRNGDIVTIERREQGEEKKLELKCNVESDTCQVVTFVDDPEKVMIVVQKSRSCVNGAGDCDVDITVDSLGDLPHGAHAVIKMVKCDDAGNCEETEKVRGGSGMNVIADFDGADGHGNVMIFKHDTLDGKVMLHCPEGDANVRVEAAEADDTFLCPKHNVPMEQGAPKTMMRKIRVKQP